MNRPATSLDYGRRIDRVVAHIGDHLDEALDLETLAGIACFSPCHFHRIYRGITGETVADTVRRLRLHHAAFALAETREPIAAIARRAGYGSVAAFTRGFRAVYGMPPASYRRQGRLVIPDRQPTEEDNTMYDVELRTTGPARLAALHHTGSYLEIGTVFERLFAWGAARNLLGPATRSFGIFHDDPHSVPVAQLRSQAGMTIGPAVEAEGGVHIVTLAGGRHAVIRHKGPYAELIRAYDWLYREWLPASGFETADRPCYEEYLNNPRTLPPEEWLTDISVPLTDA
jgi:AraC family transcriptional regulator